MSPGRTLLFWSGRRDSNPGPLHPEQVATFFRLHVCGCYLWLTRIQGVCFRSLQKPQNQFGAHYCAHWKEVHALWLMHITQSAKLRTKAQLSHWSSAALKRLASAVRFRPWPPHSKALRIISVVPVVPLLSHFRFQFTNALSFSTARSCDSGRSCS